MKKPPVRLLTLLLPLTVVGTLQIAGCARRQIPPPDPGGIYRSTSGGAQFEQSVRQVNRAGELIGYLDDINFRHLIRSPQEPSRVYAVAGSQGVFVTQDNGENWLTLPQPLNAVASVLELSSGIVVLAGTNQDGDGAVVRSLDGGRSWDPVLTMPAPKKEPSRFFEIVKEPPPPPVFVSSLASDPFQDDQLYAATSTGEILIGSESGKVWRAISRVEGRRDPLTQRANAPIQAIVASPHVRSELLVVTTNGNLLRFTEAGKEDLEINAAVQEVEFISQLPDALIAATTGGVALSHDRGQSWDPLPLPISRQTPLRGITVAVSPTNPQRILVGADSIIYRSEDGGVTWNTLSLNLPLYLITDIAVDPSNAARVLLVTRPLPT